MGRLVVWLVLSAIVTATVVLSAHQLQRCNFWPVLLAPLVLGAVGGLGYAILVRVARVHYPWACAVAAGLLATTADAALFRLAYDQYRHDVGIAARQSQGSAAGLSGFADGIVSPSAQAIPAEDLADRQLELEVGRGDFLGFVLWRAKEGIRLGGWRVRAIGIVVVWSLEGLLWIAASVAVAGSAARQPYCTVCQSWYDRQKRGRVSTDRQDELLRVLSLPLPGARAGDREVVEYELLACPEGCSPPVLILDRLTDGGYLSARRKLFFKGYLDRDRRDAVRSALVD